MVPVGLSRDANHIYTANYDAGPIVLPGVTGILKVLDKPAIIPWAQGIVAEAAIAHRSELEGWVSVGGVDGAIQLLRRAAETQRDHAAQRGVEIHSLAEAIVKGQPVVVPEDLLPYVNAYRGWLDRFQPEFLAVEEMGCSLTYSYGGTLDSIGRIAGETWLWDVKTSKGVYADTSQQLAPYGRFEFLGRPNDPTKYAMPKIDLYGVIHVRPEGAELIPFDITDREFEAFLAAKQQHQWRKDRGNSVIQQAIGPALLHFPNTPPKGAAA